MNLLICQYVQVCFNIDQRDNNGSDETTLILCDENDNYKL